MKSAEDLVRWFQRNYLNEPSSFASARITERVNLFGREVLEAAAEVQEKYGPIERSDEVAERIRKLKDFN